MLELSGKSLITPDTVKFSLLSATITFPRGLSFPKYFFAVLLVITTELSLAKGFALLPYQRKIKNSKQRWVGKAYRLFTKNLILVFIQ